MHDPAHDMKRWITLCEAEAHEIDALLAKVDQLKFVPVDGKRWRTIRDEGLDAEQSAPDRSQWIMALLPIRPEHAANLRAFDDEAVEMFNLLDIKLKERYGGKIVDLIDYDKGIVVLVKTMENE